MAPTGTGWACMQPTCFLPAFDRYRDEWEDLDISDHERYLRSIVDLAPDQNT